MGIIAELIKSGDGCVRTVTIKQKGAKLLKKTINHCFPLEALLIKFHLLLFSLNILVKFVCCFRFCVCFFFIFKYKQKHFLMFEFENQLVLYDCYNS